MKLATRQTGRTVRVVPARWATPYPSALNELVRDTILRSKQPLAQRGPKTPSVRLPGRSKALRNGIKIKAP